MRYRQRFSQISLKALIMGAAILSGLPLEQAFAHLYLKEKKWELRTGYAYQYTNESRPNNFQIIPVLPSVAVSLTDTLGSSWYKGRFVWNPELLLAAFTHPYVRPMYGITPLQFSYTLEPKGRLSPYLFIGAGILWSNINRRETRSYTNFNVQGGIGTRYRITERMSLILEYRHIHISNAGLHEDNSGINTHTFLTGISFKE